LSLLLLLLFEELADESADFFHGFGMAALLLLVYLKVREVSSQVSGMGWWRSVNRDE